MPWLVIYHGSRYGVVRDSFGRPYGPRIWHRDRDGTPILFTDLSLAWRVAHQLNRDLYTKAKCS
jgi:hypothetical protein